MRRSVEVFFSWAGVSPEPEGIEKGVRIWTFFTSQEILAYPMAVLTRLSSSHQSAVLPYQNKLTKPISFQAGEGKSRGKASSYTAVGC